MSEASEVEQVLAPAPRQRDWTRPEMAFVRHGTWILLAGLVPGLVLLALAARGSAEIRSWLIPLAGACGVGVVIGLVWIMGGLIEPRLRRRA